MEPDVIPSSLPNLVEDYQLGSNVKKLKITDNVRELQTVLRDKSTSRSDFIFYADRLIRLVVEEGLNQLPYRKCIVTTPTGHPYDGLRYEKGNCGVSIVRSGEAMEQGLRDCCRSIRIGKILIQSDEDTHEAKIVYSKLPADISNRKVLLMYPIMTCTAEVGNQSVYNVWSAYKYPPISRIMITLSKTLWVFEGCHLLKVPDFVAGTGNTVAKAVNILKEHAVDQENVILLNLFCTPQAAKNVISQFPGLTIFTSEVHPVAPNHFGQKYFGTE